MSLLTSAATVLTFATSLFAQGLKPPSDEIPPLAPPLPEIPPSAWEQYGWTLWIITPLLVAAAGLALWLALRPGKPPVLLAPATQARNSLLALQSQPESGVVLSQVSQTLRRYLTNTFWLPPHEMTTTDFCSLLNRHEKINPELAATLTDFLRTCDERKFAPAANQPPLGAARRAMELVEQAETDRALSRASVLDCGGPPPLSSNQADDAKRQRTGAVQDAGANARHPSA